MAVADGRIHASDGPTLYALDARERHRAVAAADRRLGVLAQGRPRHGRHRDPRRRRTGLGGRERREAVGDHRRPDRLRDARGRPGDPRRHGLRLAGRAGCAPWRPVRATSAGRTRSATPASCGGVPVRLTPRRDGYVYVVRGHPGPRHRRRQRPGPLALRGPGGLPLPARLRARARRSRAAASTSPTTSARCTPWTPPTARTGGASPRRPAPPSSRCWSPTGHVHVGSGRALYTLDAVTGTPEVAVRGGRRRRRRARWWPTGRIHFGSTDHLLYTLDADDGQLRWKLATGGEITGAPGGRRTAWCTRAARTAACTRWTRRRARGRLGTGGRLSVSCPAAARGGLSRSSPRP